MKKNLLILTLCIATAGAKGQTINSTKEAEDKIKEVERYIDASRKEQDSIRKQIESLEKKMNKTNKNNSTINGNDGYNTNTYVIVYNFATKTYDTNLVRPRIHHPVVFKVKNINRLAYLVTITSKDSILAVSDLPDGFDFKTIAKDTTTQQPKIESEAVKTILPKVEGNSLTDEYTKSQKERADTIANKMNRSNALVSKQKETDQKIRESNDELQKSNELLSQLKINLDKNKEELKLIDIDINAIPVDDAKRKELENNKLALDSAKYYQNEISLVEKKIKLLDSDISKLKSETININIQLDAISVYRIKLDTLVNTYNVVYNQYSKLWAIKRAYSKLASFALNPLLSYADFEMKRQDASLVPTSIQIESFRQEVAAFYKLLIRFNIEYVRATDTWELQQIFKEDFIKELLKPVDDLKKRVDQINNSVNEQRFSGVIDKILFIINTLSKPESFEMTSSPIQPSQDLVIFDIDIKERQASDYHDGRKFSYREFVRGGVRYDFSTGLTFSSMRDYSYSTIPVTADSVMIVRNSRNNNYSPTIVAMLHASIRTSSLVSVALTLGAGINTSSLDINAIFPGLSLMFGKREKIILTGGAALQKVQYLDDEFELDKPYLKTSFENKNIAVPTFRVGWFVGVSYNLTKKQKSNFKIIKE